VGATVSQNYSLAVNTVGLAQSTVSVAPATIQAGGTATVTLTTRDSAGNPETSGGLTVAFGLGAGSAGGTFTAVTDNHNGTYTTTFTAGSALGSDTITATIGSQPVTSTPPTVTVAQSASLAQTIVTVNPGAIVTGSSATVTLTAKDA